MGHPATDRKAAVEMKDVFGDIFSRFFSNAKYRQPGGGVSTKLFGR